MKTKISLDFQIRISVPLSPIETQSLQNFQRFLTSAWNAECRQNKIWKNEKWNCYRKNILNCNILRFELGILIIY